MPGAYGELRYIKPEDLHQVWEVIKPGIEKVKKYAPEDWLAEDIYTALRAQTSYLYVAYIGAYAGFCVVTPIQGFGSRSMNIWLAYSTEKHDVIGLFWDDIEKIARSLNATKITFISPRKGFARRMKQYGFVPTHVVYEKNNNVKKPLNHHAEE